MAAQGSSSPPAGTVDRFGLNVHSFQYEPAAFPLVAEARVGWVRLAAWWRFIEKQQGVFDFDYLDRSVDAALANGLKILIVFASIPGWANGTPAELGIMDENGSLPPANPQFFRDFVTKAVQRYRGRVRHYEVWNEPNYKTFWNGDYDRFINEILISGSQAVKAADPDAKTMGPATDRSLEKFKRAALKACNHLDFLSCHLYRKNARALFKDADENYQPFLKEKCNKPLWVTEFGIDSWETGEEAQAKELTAAYESLLKPEHAYLKRLFVFEWRDGYWPSEGQRGWGLVRNAIEGLQRKKSFWAVQDLALRQLGRPGVATSPEPADGATRVPLTAPLTWRAGRGARSHRLSVGTESPAFQREQPDLTFPASAAAREHGRTYLWRVDEVGDGGVTSGTVWRFTVEDDPAAEKDVIVRVRDSSPFFLAVIEGQGCVECAAARSLVRTDAAADKVKGEWTVGAPATGPTDLTFLRPAGQAALDLLTITVSGLRPGKSYRVFGRFVTTTQQVARGAAIRMGLDPARMTSYRSGVDGAVVRKAGRWEEREVEIGSATAGGGSLKVLLDGQGAAELAGWSGLRLAQEAG